MRNSHPSQIIMLVTLCEGLFTLRYFVAALAWYFGSRDERDSFHIIPDNCWTASLWGQFFAVAAVMWNACWVVELVAVLYAPLRNTKSFSMPYHVASWGVAVVTTVILATQHNKSESKDHVCWVLGDAEH